MAEDDLSVSRRHGKLLKQRRGGVAQCVNADTADGRRDKQATRRQNGHSGHSEPVTTFSTVSRLRREAAPPGAAKALLFEWR
jgi:hypothetical protein